MCLGVYKKEYPLHGKYVADADIVCYKVVLCARSYNEWLVRNGYSVELVRNGYSAEAEGVAYMAPYQHTPYEIGKEYKSILSVDMFGSKDSDEWFGVEAGLHTFMELDDAEVERIYFLNLYDGAVNVAIVECRIPQGSTYYRGEFGTEIGSFASDTLVLDKVIKE